MNRIIMDQILTNHIMSIGLLSMMMGVLTFYTLLMGNSVPINNHYTLLDQEEYQSIHSLNYIQMNHD